MALILFPEPGSFPADDPVPNSTYSFFMLSPLLDSREKHPVLPSSSPLMFPTRVPDVRSRYSQ